MIKKDPQFNFRLPEELKQWVEGQAHQNRRSQTSELIFILVEERKRREQAAA